ncbi:MAG: hypothetical protein KBH99_09240 [Syntrophobacteraceae bacterium]|nr:hypothetical protein [Syntrophobacteraceae bacterium]
MARTLRRISLVFAGGFFGAFVNSVMAWYLGRKGVPQQFGVHLASGWSAHYLYPKLVWGGLWGLLFLAPAWRTGFWVGVFSRGILFSLLPTLFQLLYVFPVLDGKGILGLTLGKLTPVFVFFYNAVWGFCTALWVYASKADA